MAAVGAVPSGRELRSGDATAVRTTGSPTSTDSTRRTYLRSGSYMVDAPYELQEPRLRATPAPPQGQPSSYATPRISPRLNPGLWPDRYDLADRIRSIYEQVTEDLMDGRTYIPAAAGTPVRSRGQRLKLACDRLAELDALDDLLPVGSMAQPTIIRLNRTNSISVSRKSSRIRYRSIIGRRSPAGTGKHGSRMDVTQ